MNFPPARLTLTEECKQVVLAAPIDGLTAVCACALATSPLVPLNCRVLVHGVSMQNSCPSFDKDGPHTARSSTDARVATRDFMSTVQQVEAKLKASRTTRRNMSATHMTQFFYGGVSPKADEIGPMLRRISVLGSGTAGNANVATSLRGFAVASDGGNSTPLVEDSVFVLVLNAQSLGSDTEGGLEGYSTFLRHLWSAAGFPQPQKRARGSLVMIVDDVYRAAVCAMLSSIAKEVATAIDWVVLLAYSYSMDPPALEFGAAEVAVQAVTGISQGGILPALCAANALGVLRHFPVSRSEPAAITPVDVILNAALLGHIYLRQGQLPECVECADDLQYCGTSTVLADAGAAAAAKTMAEGLTPPARCVTRHRIASFAVAESRKPGEASFVWGMLGEYLMGYYGRFADQISAAFPVADVLARAPILQFPFRLADLANFGPEPRAAAYALEGWRAYQQRQRLMEAEVVKAEVAQVLKAYVAQMDGTVGCIQRIAREAAVRDKAPAAVFPASTGTAPSSFAARPYRLDEFNVALYYSLLRRLASNYALMPYHQCVALVEVDWEAYVSVVARAVLEHLARRVLCSLSGVHQDGSRFPAPPVVDIASIVGVVRNPPVGNAPVERASASAATPSPTNPKAVAANDSFAFPEPRRHFTNDIVYHGAGRIPPLPTFTRKYLDPFVFLHRIGMTANGWRADMTPGMTPQVLTAIIAQPDIQRLMTALAAKDGASKKDVEAHAKRILLQCGDTLNHVPCRATGLMVLSVFRRIYGRIDVNGGAYERLHRYFAMPRVAVVLVPLHRSYIDFLVLSEVLALMQLPLPHIVAGENFLSMGIVAALMRGSGAFFMRRSFRGDPLYAALLKGYVRHLVRARRPLEFFIEGARSRTGKTMAPRMGLLKFVCDTFYEPGQQELDDVLMVPVSLSYDEVLEATTHAKELLGVPKPKESPMNMLKARSLLNRMHGNINIHVGEPVSLRSLKKHPLKCPPPLQPHGEHLSRSAAAAANTASGRKTLDTTPSMADDRQITPAPLLATIAWHLIYRLQRNTVITPASMVSAVVECLGPYCSPSSTQLKEGSDTTATAPAAAAVMPLEKVRQGVQWLRGLLRHRGAQLSKEADELSPDRLVTLALVNLYRYLHITGDMSGVAYRSKDVVTRIAVNISTNQLIHVCVDEALIAIVAQAFGSATTPHRQPSDATGGMLLGVRSVNADVLKSQTQLLQRLLSVEFPIYAAAAPMSFASWLECTLSRLQQHCLEESTAPFELSSTNSCGGTVVHVPVTQYFYFLLQLICPHVEALYAVLVTASTLLAAFPGKLLGAADVLTTTQRVCSDLYAERKLFYVVAANKESLQHYYESLVALSVLQLKRPSGIAVLGQSKVNSGVVAYTIGSLGQEAALARLDALSGQMQALCWHPSTEAERCIGKEAIQERILRVYRELMHHSKM
ncbi:hypothetical protein LSCM1_02165 [Leishmania martiniquensis]|uniref:Phospholipid/glycerol acyltransferase domain-containing protein n=1 Tax=Leishmania martiniquensis TaxID=1580590 RepID=A0A836G9V9_9TRYP|nr:hypothetical protein LSCM1_02165 [Leishmania martiniquensis]